MKCYIIHVSDAYERELHMQKELKDKQLDHEYINYGDIKDLSDQNIKKYFTGNMANKSAATSCAFKHILSYKKLKDSNEYIAMILEDDIHFYPNHHLLQKFIDEIKAKNLTNFLVSLEDSNLRYVPRSNRKNNNYLYPANKGRLAGAYLLDNQAANNILAYIEQEKVDIPIDWFHNKCADNDIIDIYWSQPAITVQGSLDGSIESIIDNKRTGITGVLIFKLKRLHRKLLYLLR